MEGFGIAIFVFGILGAGIAAWSLSSAYFELAALIIRGQNGPKKMSSITNVVTDAFQLAQQIIVSFAGYAFVAFDHAEARGEAMAWLFISGLSMFSLIINRLRRIRVMAMYDARLAEVDRIGADRRKS